MASASANRIGHSVLVYDELDSTNTLALALGDDPSRHGTIVRARTQTAGRGQYGRLWIAPPDSSVLLSALLFPPADLTRPVLLTALAAVSVCDTIAQLTDLQATIKWPNDVLIAKKKVCGILIEQRGAGSSHTCVIGIGLNVNQTPAMFAEADLPEAASLASLSGEAIRCDDVGNALIDQLERHYQRLITGDLASLQASWEPRFALKGKQVNVETATQPHQGRMVAMNFEAIELGSDDGKSTRLAPEIIRAIRCS